MFQTDFSFVDRVEISSKFKRQACPVVHLNKGETKAIDILAQAPQLFEELKHGKIDLDILDVFALMSWSGVDWQSADGQRAIRHWWQSALDKPLLSLIMMFRVVYADSERWPGPRPVIQAISNEMQRLIDQGIWQDNANLLKIIIRQNAEALADFALKQQKAIHDIMRAARFPEHLPIIREAEPYYLNMWIGLKKENRQLLRGSIQQLLNTDSLERQQQFAMIILNTGYLPKNIAQLEAKVGDYPEIVNWISLCARNHNFKLPFNEIEKQRLNCWIGTGNYESLRKILLDAAKIYAPDESNILKTYRRYIFWENYQTIFEEAYLLLPSFIYDRYAAELNNVKELDGYSFPVIALRMKGKFVFQSFFGDASQNDLLMTDNIVSVEQYLSQPLINYNDIKNLNLILIHDHAFKWQSDLAYTLDKHFAIQAKQQRVYYMERNYSYYMKDAVQSYFQHERKAPDNLPRWVENVQKKYPKDVLSKAALTAKRYGLIKEPVTIEEVPHSQTILDAQELESGVWTDPITGLMWARISIGQEWDNRQCFGTAHELTWNEAEAVCQHFKLGGYHDWRLPTIDELKTLMLERLSGYNCPKDVLFKPSKDLHGWYWSSSNSALNDDDALNITFTSGGIHTSSKRLERYSRAVRGSMK